MRPEIGKGSFPIQLNDIIKRLPFWKSFYDAFYKKAGLRANTESILYNRSYAVSSSIWSLTV